MAPVGDPGEWSTDFSLELAVEATDTGCLGLELRRGGESFGGGADMKAFRRLLFAFALAGPDVVICCGGPFRELPAPVGVFERRPDGVPALDERPLARDPLGAGEGKPELGGLPPVPDLSLRADPGRLDCAEPGREF